MIVGQSKTLGVPKKPTSPKANAKKSRDRTYWEDRSEELREYLLLVDQEKLEDAGRIIKSVGSALKGVGQQIKDIPRKVFDWDVVAEKVDENKREQLVQWGEIIGKTVGFTAAGGHAIGGALKFASGSQQKDTSRKLDGIMDIATATTLAAAVAGLGTARSILAPIAATFNIFRGSYNSGHGFKTNDDRKQIQGALDAVRSAGSVGRLLKNHAPFFKFAGVALAPIAGAIQAGRGLHDVAIGLRNDDNKKQLKGLVDIATAVGTAMAFASGVAIIPGVALAVAANLTKAAYEVSPRFRKKVDPIIDRYEPKLTKIVENTERLTKPVQKLWNKVVSRFVKATEEEGPDQYTSAQLAEIAHLLSADGEYTRQEERRLKTSLEKTGEADELPSRKEKPGHTNRGALKMELSTKEKRTDFLRYLLVTAHYDNVESPEEKEYLDDLAQVLELTPAETEALREERIALNLTPDEEA